MTGEYVLLKTLFKDKKIIIVAELMLLLIAVSPLVRSQEQWLPFGAGFAVQAGLMAVVCLAGEHVLLSLITEDAYSHVMGAALYMLIPALRYLVYRENIIAGALLWMLLPIVVTLFVLLYRKKNVVLLLGFCIIVLIGALLAYRFNILLLRNLLIPSDMVNRYEFWQLFTVYVIPEGLPGLGLGAVCSLVLMLWVKVVLRVKTSGVFFAGTVLTLIALFLSIESVFTAHIHRFLSIIGIPVLRNSTLMLLICALISVLSVQALDMLKAKEKGAFARIYVPVGITVLTVAAYFVTI